MANYSLARLAAALNSFSNTPTLTTPVLGAATGTSLAVTGNIATSAGYFRKSLDPALTAVGTNRATSLQLAKAINLVATAAAGTGVTLPLASTVGIGGSVFIFHEGANDIKVYGAGSDTIDTAAAATGVTLTAGKRCEYIVTAAATWISAQLGVVSA